MENKLERLTEILKYSNNIVFFGGAGVSTESGIPDFRSSSGLYNEKLNINFTPEQLISNTFFMKYPEEFFKFYKEKLIYPKARPNNAHIVLAKLEEMGKLKAIVSQNIDGLHQAAGSKRVYELHGSVLRNYCLKCGAFYDEKYILDSVGVPLCEKCGGYIKPDVVLYEESLDMDIINKSIIEISKAETLIIGGTSLSVYPAASLIDYFNGKNLVLINKTSTPADDKSNLVINDSIATVLYEATKFL